jgi:uncharacterized protein YndB with AHSA1/START domain
MTTTNPASFDLKMARTLDAPVDRVWTALTDADQIARWYGPGEAFRVEVLEWDCRIGGKYRVAMHQEDGPTHTCFGVFQALERNQRIAYTWAWEGQPPIDTVVTFTLTPDGEGTRLEFAHTGFPAEDVREQHRMGWTGSMERLATLVG